MGEHSLLTHRFPDTNSTPLIDRRLPRQECSQYATFRFPVDQRRERLPRRAFTHGRSAAVPRCAPMAMDCPTCGRPNADGKDCCDCGEYLRWDAAACSRCPPGVRRRGPGGAHRLTAAARHERAADPRPDRAGPARPARPGAPPGNGPPTVTLAVATAGLLQGVVRNQTQRVDSYAPARERAPGGVGRDLAPVGRPAPRTAPRVTRTSRTSSSPSRRPAPRVRVPDVISSASKRSRAPPARSSRARRARSRSCPTASSTGGAPGDPCGRRRVRFTATAATTGNAPLEVELSARDREEKFNLSFSPPLLHLEPTTPTDAQLTATPRRPHWIGRPREQTLAVSASAPASRRPRRRSSPSGRRHRSRSGSRR